jgi:hypothetical protein
VELVARVVDVVLGLDRVAPEPEDPRERIAHRGRARIDDDQRAGGVGRDELEEIALPVPASAPPYVAPWLRMSPSARAHQAELRNTLTKPGPAISRRSTAAILGKWETMASATLRGGCRAARASVIATLVA